MLPISARRGWPRTHTRRIAWEWETANKILAPMNEDFLDRSQWKGNCHRVSMSRTKTDCENKINNNYQEKHLQWTVLAWISILKNWFFYLNCLCARRGEKKTINAHNWVNFHFTTIYYTYFVRMNIIIGLAHIRAFKHDMWESHVRDVFANYTARPAGRGADNITRIHKVFAKGKDIC